MSLDRSYQETIDYLYALQKHGIKLALANTEALMSLTGNPHRKFRSVHIAGTNGKGSTSVFIANMLEAAGLRVGLYTSPHLVSFTERIRVNGRNIPEARVVELARRIREGYAPGQPGASAPLNPTFFEVTTAIAFTYFAELSVDIAVVETGMGGRLDSTNVITPLVSLITNIDLEHTEFLGETLELIASEKAGIIKSGIPLITGAAQPVVLDVIRKKADSAGSRVYRLGADFIAVPKPADRRQQFDYRGIKASFENLAIGMLGRHQVNNACLAVAAVECLREAGVSITERDVRTGLEQAFWDGRLERVARNPDIYLDGAHNPASARMLSAAVTDLKSGYRRLLLVIGILSDKDVQGIISELVPLADEVIVTRPDYSRAMDTALLSAEVKKMHAAVKIADTVAHALEQAREEAGPDDLILVTGSLYVVGDARAILVRAGVAREFPGLKG